MCSAELVLIGYDARSTSAQLTNQMKGVYSSAVLTSGPQSTVRHSAGVLYGFVVGFSASAPPVTDVRLQLLRPRADDTYQLVCQRHYFFLRSNASELTHQVSALSVSEQWTP